MIAVILWSALALFVVCVIGLGYLTFKASRAIDKAARRAGSQLGTWANK